MTRRLPPEQQQRVLAMQEFAEEHVTKLQHMPHDAAVHYLAELLMANTLATLIQAKRDLKDTAKPSTLKYLNGGANLHARILKQDVEEMN